MSTTAQNQGTFKITKDMLLGFCKKGLTVSEMSAKITAISGFKCSVGLVTKAAKYYEVNLQKKPMKSHFEFEDEGTTTETEKGFTLS